MTAKLFFITGSRAGTSVSLEDGPSTIGRNPKSVVRFAPDEVLVSSDHARIEQRGDEYVLIDVGSRNGTFVNEKRLEDEVVLAEGDLIRFGSRGPTVRFATSSSEFLIPTLDGSREPTTGEIFREARRRSSERHSSDTAIARGFSTTREFAALAIQKSSRRAKVTTVALVTVMSAAVVGGLWWQERNRAALQNTLDEIALQLQDERGLRSTLEENLASIRSGYDSLLVEVESRQRQLEDASRASAGLAESIRAYGDGVALIVFSYGFGKRGSDDLLRFQLDRNGRPIMERAPNGEAYPRIGFAGDGPPVARHGSATGFLVDTAGWIVTNRHVAQPWEQETDLEFLRNNGLDVEPRFIEMEAYFPPGGRAHRLVVHRSSRQVDLAVLRAASRNLVNTPTIPLEPVAPAVPGQQIVFIGYPTGVHNLLFRIPESERARILEATDQQPVPLARELARRGLIQPLVIQGSVSDTTATEIIHTAGTTGGGSGGPLIGPSRNVVGIHYAAVRSPIEGDPFQTQRAVRVRFVMELLPQTTRD